MIKSESHAQSEIAVLGRGVESVLRRLIRLIVGQFSLTKLHEMINQLFLEELEEKLRSAESNQDVTLSMLALNSGLDTRQINRIRNGPRYRNSLFDDAEFLRDLTPAASFLHLWTTDPRFLVKSTGMPKPLVLDKEGEGVELLKRDLGLPRGVTITSVISQLEASDLIAVDREKKLITLQEDRYLPTPDRDYEGALEVGLVAVSRLLDTVTSNLHAANGGSERLYQRIYWINRLSETQRSELRANLREILDVAEKKGYQTLSGYDRGFDLPNQISAGFGLYYFEDAAPDSSDSENKSEPTRRGD